MIIDEDPRSIIFKTDTQLTEMGIRVTIGCPTVRVTVEFDLDEDPVVMLAALQYAPQMISEQVERMTKEGVDATGRLVNPDE